MGWPDTHPPEDGSRFPARTSAAASLANDCLRDQRERARQSDLENRFRLIERRLNVLAVRLADLEDRHERTLNRESETTTLKGNELLTAPCLPLPLRCSKGARLRFPSLPRRQRFTFYHLCVTGTLVATVYGMTLQQNTIPATTYPSASTIHALQRLASSRKDASKNPLSADTFFARAYLDHHPSENFSERSAWLVLRLTRPHGQFPSRTEPVYAYLGRESTLARRILDYFHRFSGSDSGVDLHVVVGPFSPSTHNRVKLLNAALAGSY